MSTRAFDWRWFLGVAGMCIAVCGAARGQAAKLEFLQGDIAPANAAQLRALACRNFGQFVHVDISVTWPKETLDVETNGWERLVFWDKSAEYLFPKGSYALQNGVYKIRGYFKVRNGGKHAGMISDSFELPPSTEIMPPEGSVETRVTSTACARIK